MAESAVRTIPERSGRMVMGYPSSPFDIESMDRFPATQAVSPTDLLEPGDRFEVNGPPTGDRLWLPREVGPGGFALERLEDPAGRPLEMTIEAGDHALVVPRLAQALPASSRALWLEYQSPGRF